MKPRAARACARPLTAPSTMTLRKQPNRARCAVNCRIHRSLERARRNSSAGYRPATLPLDSQVGSLAARPIASIGPRSSTWVETILSDRSLPRQAHSSRASGSAVRYPVNLRTVDGCEVADDDRPLVEVDPARFVPGLWMFVDAFPAAVRTGTEGSDPPPSSAESANYRFRAGLPTLGVGSPATRRPLAWSRTAGERHAAEVNTSGPSGPN